VLHAGGFELPGGPRDDAWGALPIALRRLGGVGCVACHGPGAIPAPESRWAVLRSDVCATCHDAPPRYGHVAAWRESKMSRSDADARTREDSACRTCHTTSGFLARIGVRTEEQPPEGIGPLGIACAACHAPHGENVGTALLRAVPVANRFADADARSRVCVACHAPLEPGDALPAASAAPIVLARGGSIDGTAEHRAVEGTCIGCHRAGPEGIERGAAHGFAADASACAACHEDDVLDRARVASAEIASRARELFAELSAAGVVRGTLGEGLGPLHAARPELVDPASPLAPAARDVVLVLEDPAAGAHGPRYARELLDAAAAAIR